MEISKGSSLPSCSALVAALSERRRRRQRYWPAGAPHPSSNFSTPPGLQQDQRLQIQNMMAQCLQLVNAILQTLRETTAVQAVPGERADAKKSRRATTPPNCDAEAAINESNAEAKNADTNVKIKAETRKGAALKMRQPVALRLPHPAATKQGTNKKRAQGTTTRTTQK